MACFTWSIVPFLFPFSIPSRKPLDFDLKPPNQNAIPALKSVSTQGEARRRESDLRISRFPLLISYRHTTALRIQCHHHKPRRLSYRLKHTGLEVVVVWWVEVGYTVVNLLLDSCRKEVYYLKVDFVNPTSRFLLT